MITALVVDDQPDMRLLLSLVLDDPPAGLAVAGTASDGWEAVTLATALAPTVVVIDEMMPGLTGCMTATRIRATRPDQRIVLCTAFPDDAIRERARLAGIDRVIGKEDLAALPALVRALADG